MHSNEDYMDEDGPEFIAMINDVVRNVRSESQAQPASHLPDRKYIPILGLCVDHTQTDRLFQRIAIHSCSPACVLHLDSMMPG